METIKTIYILVLITIIFGCVERREGEQKNTLISNFVSITDNENKGIKEIVNFYGGQCKYSKGYSASTGDGKKKYFEIEMSQSEAIEKYTRIAEMPASNVAYIFYKNLDEEKQNYDEIHIILKLANGEEMSFEFPLSELAIVEGRIPTVLKIVELIRKKHYSNLKPYINDTGFTNFSKDELVSNLEESDSKLGDVQEFLLFGFRINEDDNGKRYLHISGAMIREIQNHEFSVDFDLEAPKDEILLISYKL